MCTRMCMFMVTKTITITKESYDILKNVKKTEESFSVAIKRLFNPPADLMRFAGCMKDITHEDAKNIKESIRTLREHSVKRLHTK